VYLKTEVQPRAVTEMLKTFDAVKDTFGSKLPAS
jgi:hypothetical protein